MKPSEKTANDDAVLRTAMRISTRAWSKLELESHKLSEAQALKEYLRLCPYVSAESSVMMAALEAIEHHHPQKSLYTTARPTSSPEDSPVASRATPRQDIHPDKKSVPQPTSSPSSLWRLARVLFLDIPLVLLLLTYAAVEWCDHLHHRYFFPQLQDAKWTSERSDEEITYYVRHCTADDMTTKKGADLFLPDGATTEESYQHQLKHGFSVFRDVLTPETASNLRNHVVAKNRNLTDEESIFVIENTNRFSFGLGTEEPAVAQAMKELATNERLKPALEKILGENPALIEMTAITSSYGAVAQYWHDDVIPTGSAINFARSFGPSYSVFVQLQNTTKEMGATSACPGTHYCSDGNLADFCEKEGFQLVNEDGHWKQGDALLMNMNSYHRGAAHTDPNAEDRVMLILTFAPKPTTVAESRQMSQGITFSLRWDMWGHTLNDLAKADTAMTQPWATLRSLGLYKPADAEWGIDYISSCLMRMASSDNGFRKDQLDDFLQAGGIPYLPQFLQGRVRREESWYKFLSRTFFLCKSFLFKVVIGAIAFYMLASLVALLHPAHKSPLTFIVSAVGRVGVFAGVAALAYLAAKTHVDGTEWAADIKGHRRYASTTEAEARFATDPASWPTTFPTNKDVLFETRYTSRQLAMYNDFIDGHPANSFYRSLLDKLAPSFKDYPFEFQEGSASYVIEAIGAQHGRFLHQSPDGAWYWMDDSSISDRVKKDLLLASSPRLSALAREMRFLLADLKYGALCETAMASLHIAPFLADLEEKLFPVQKPVGAKTQQVIKTSKKPSSRPAHAFKRKSGLPQAASRSAAIIRHTSSLPPPPVFTEPFLGSWIKENDTVDGFFDGHWYMGKVSFVSAHGSYTVSYPDGDENAVDAYRIRPFEPYKKGEEVEVYRNNVYENCEIVRKAEDNTYTVLIRQTGEFVAGFDSVAFRRPKGMLRERYQYKSAY